MATLQEQIVKYLTDAHGLEEQSLRSLQASAKSADDAALKAVFEQHLAETRRQQERIAERLRALGGEPSTVKDTGNALISFGKGVVDTLRKDNAGKNLRDAYIGEAVEIISYQLLIATAKRGDDHETVALAESILAEERAAQEKLTDLIDHAVEVSLEVEGAPTSV